MFRLFWKAIVALVVLAVAWAVMKALLLLVVMALAFAVVLPVFALWLWLDPSRRRSWKDWKAREFSRAFSARLPVLPHR